MSSLSAVEVKKMRTDAVHLPPPVVKSCDRALRIGLASASYATHFLDGVSSEVSTLIKAIEDDDEPPTCSQLVDALKRTQSFVEMAQSPHLPTLR